jgi:hypothetical protein
LAMIATLMLVFAACSGSSGARSAPTVPGSTTTTSTKTSPAEPSSTAVARAVRGESLAMNSIAYLASNPVSPLFRVRTQAPAALVVGNPIDIVVQITAMNYAAWVGLHAQRRTVHAHDGPGRIKVVSDGCPLTGAAACDSRPLYSATSQPIAPPPSAPGVVLQRPFTLHLATGAIEPGRYDMTFPIQYPLNFAPPNLLAVSDVLHVRIDVGSRPPASTHCTLADLHMRPPPMPTPHPVTETFVFVNGDDRLDPPLSGAHARIPAIVAWRHLASTDGGAGGTKVLVLARLTTVTPARPGANGTMHELTHNVLAWVLYTHDEAVNSGLLSGPGPMGPTDRAPVTVASAPCAFFDGLAAMNATTGQELLAEGGSMENDPIQP